MKLGNITEGPRYAYVEFELEEKTYVVQFIHPVNNGLNYEPMPTRREKPDPEVALYNAAKNAVSEFLMNKLFEESDALKKLKQ